MSDIRVAEYELGEKVWHKISDDCVDTSEHDAKVRAEAIDEFAHALKETFNNEFPSNYHCTKPYFTLDNVRALVDLAAKEQKNDNTDKKS